MRIKAYGDRLDEEAFLHGLYFNMALKDVMSGFSKDGYKPIYPKEPLSWEKQKDEIKPKKQLTPKEKDEIFREAMDALY